MEFLTNHLLSLILFVPTVAAVALLFLPKERVNLIRWFAFGASLIPFVLTLVVWVQFQAGKPGFQFEASRGRQDRGRRPRWNECQAARSPQIWNMKPGAAGCGPGLTSSSCSKSSCPRRERGKLRRKQIGKRLVDGSDRTLVATIEH